MAQGVDAISRFIIGHLPWRRRSMNSPLRTAPFQVRLSGTKIFAMSPSGHSSRKTQALTLMFHPSRGLPGLSRESRYEMGFAADDAIQRGTLCAEIKGTRREQSHGPISHSNESHWKVYPNGFKTRARTPLPTRT
jgi:hypothetical protein